MAYRARGLLNRRKIAKRESLVAYPPPSPNPLLYNAVVVVVVVSRIQRIGCQLGKTTLHGGQSRSWSAEQGKENKIKRLAAYSPPPPPTLLVRRKKYIYHATHLQALRRSRSVSRPYKDIFGSSTTPMGVASQNSTLPSAITSFPVSLLFSSPGDV